MPLASITRLRLRSYWYLFPFIYRAQISGRQALRSPGCRGFLTRKTQGLTFWTLTLWDDEQSMRAFLLHSPHKEVMPKLAAWCDEASVAHWVQESPELPEWEDAAEAMTVHGRLVRVRFPSAIQQSGRMNVT